MRNIIEKIRMFPDWQLRNLQRHYADDASGLFIAKTLAFILLSCGLTMLVFNIYFMFAGPQYFATSTKIALLPIYFVPVFVFALAYRYLMIGNYKLARNMFSAITILAITSSIIMTGGFFNSIAAPFLVVIPVMVFLLHGMKAGTWIAIAVPCFIVLQNTFMHHAGLKFPDYTSHANPDMNTITTNMSLYLLVIAMVASYEYQRKNLRQEVQKEKEKLAELANRDPLTGLSNTRHYYARLEKHIDANQSGARQAALLYLDLNNFKQVNDNFGHQTGDRVLMEIANRIRKCVRPQDLVTRMGGDEFVIFISDDFSPASLANICSRLQSAISLPIKLQEVSHEVGVSIGQCTYPEDTNEIGAMLQIADQRMYKDKNRQISQRLADEIDAMPHLGATKSA